MFHRMVKLMKVLPGEQWKEMFICYSVCTVSIFQKELNTSFFLYPTLLISLGFCKAIQQLM